MPGPRKSPRKKNKPKLIAWARPEQEQLLRDAIETADLQLVAVGSDHRAGAADLGAAFDVERLGDVREAIQCEDVDLLWLAVPVSIATDERRLIRERKLRTISSEPLPTGIADLISDPAEADTARFVPLMRRSEGFLTAMQLLGDLPPPHSLYLSFRSRCEDGTLFARLFDAMDLIDRLCGDVETISATLADPNHDATSAGRHVPDSLLNFSGHMSINFHLAENRCASAQISNGAGSWFRGVTLLGEGGCLRVTDHECLFTGEPGTSFREKADRKPTPGQLVGEHVLRLLGDLDRDDPPPNVTRLLSLCEAARLSCRTRQAESPSRVLAMLSHV